MSFTPVASRVADENMSSISSSAASKKRKRMSDTPKETTKRSTLAATNGNTEPVPESFTENEQDGSEPDISTTAAAALTAHLNEGRNMSFASTGSNEERPADESFNMDSSSRYPYSPDQGTPHTNGAGQKPTVGSDEWHQVRRNNHKEVERRRRETINEGINELAKIVPGCEKNKGAVLARAVNYIADLKSRQEQASEQKSMEKSVLEQAVNELMSRNEEYKERNATLETELQTLKDEVQNLKKGKKD